jgi:hypothetical protein
MILGVKRFRIVDGVEPIALYHEVVVEPFEDDNVEPGHEFELIRHRQRTVELFRTLLQTAPGVDESKLQLDTRVETSFPLAATFQIDPAWQQGLLELHEESERLDAIDRLLLSALESQQNGDGPINTSLN